MSWIIRNCETSGVVVRSHLHDETYFELILAILLVRDCLASQHEPHGLQGQAAL
jgi:hypothetical protein